MVFAPSSSDSYYGLAFSGLTDTLTALATAGGPTDDLWRTLDQHLAAVTHLVTTAGAVLTDQLWTGK